MRVSSLPKAVTWWKRTGRGSNPRPFGSWANALPLSHTNHWHFMCRYNLLYLNNVILIPFIYLFPVSSSILQNRCVTGGGWSLSRRSHAIGRSRWTAAAVVSHSGHTTADWGGRGEVAAAWAASSRTDVLIDLSRVHRCPQWQVRAYIIYNAHKVKEKVQPVVSIWTRTHQEMR